MLTFSPLPTTGPKKKLLQPVFYSPTGGKKKKKGKTCHRRNLNSILIIKNESGTSQWMGLMKPFSLRQNHTHFSV